ncbi:MAG: hypothetical protein ABI947_17300 [Chloroflexota bacterium]
MKDGGDGFLRKLLEPNPDQNGTADVLALNMGQTTQPSIPVTLLGFAVKLLNLAAQATQDVGGLGRVLRQS